MSRPLISQAVNHDFAICTTKQMEFEWTENLDSTGRADLKIPV